MTQFLVLIPFCTVVGALSKHQTWSLLLLAMFGTLLVWFFLLFFPTQGATETLIDATGYKLIEEPSIVQSKQLSEEIGK